MVGDTSNSFCIDPNHIAPLTQYYTDLTNGTLPSFAFIEAGYANNDEHPGSGQSVLTGQVEMSKVLNAFMASSSWSDSVFFFSYDEGGGPYEHVPPVPGHSNANTDASLLASTTIPDIASIAVNADSYFPCPPPNPRHRDHPLRRAVGLARGQSRPTRRRSTALPRNWASVYPTSSSRRLPGSIMCPTTRWTTRRF